MKALSTIVILLSGALICGCDIATGSIRRYAYLEAPLSIDCVRYVLQNDIDEIKEVKYEHSKEGRPITLTGLKSPDDVHSFFYRGENENIWAHLLIIINYKGEIRFSQSHGYIGRPPDQAAIQEAINASRPVMIKVERLLESKCGIQDLQARIVEDCYKVDCPKLPE